MLCIQNNILIMIRLFYNTCKAFKQLKGFNELIILKYLSNNTDLSCCRCPSCSAPSEKYVKNGTYDRHFTHIEGDVIVDSMITIQLKQCTSCQHSHALLQYLIIPYSSFSLGFIVTLLYSKLSNKFSSINEICAHFDISQRTYYRIMHRLMQDYHALSKTMSQYSKLLEIISSLYSSSHERLKQLLKNFFEFAGHSFMQPCITLRLSYFSP